jgi:hypothetical protein
MAPYGETRSEPGEGAETPICWAVAREREHSPGRVDDDARILRMSAAALEAEGFRVRLVPADDLARERGPLPQYLFHMCERADSLTALGRLEARGVVAVNRPAGVRNAHRDLSLFLFESVGVPVPATRIVDTSASLPARFEPCWVKQSDHKTREGDVRFVETRAQAEETLSGLRERGIRRAVLQRHVDGDHVKFYGVGKSGEEACAARFFEWLYLGGPGESRNAFEVRRLCDLAFRAAGALDLEVFGGDAVVDARGRIHLIDLNAWPSFAPCRETASQRIGEHLLERFRAFARC